MKSTENSGASLTASAELEHHALKEEFIRGQLERMLAHSIFQNSKRSGGLLKFIVERTLAGDSKSLKERIIGIEVFGRAADFETSLDSTVRSAATELRRRIHLYYNEPEHRGEIHIEIPVRSYVAEFRAPEEYTHKSAELQATAKGSVFVRLRHLIPQSNYLAAVIVVALVAYCTYRLFVQSSAIDRFWAPVLASPESTIVILAPPSNRSVLQATANASESLTKQLDSASANISMADHISTVSLAAFLGRHDKDCNTELAQNTELSRLKGHSLILLGGLRNTWVMRFGDGLRFRLKEDPGSNLRWIEDATNPGNRNWSVDSTQPRPSITTEYTLVTRAFNASTGQWWIGISGLRGTGTLATRLFLLDPTAMTVLNKSLPNGWYRKNVQLVLSIDEVNDSPGAVHIIAANIW